MEGDFNTDTATICDIDFFRRKPTFNNIGADYFGTKRLKAPEEYICGAQIDEATNVFTLGALLFQFFGNFTKEDIMRRYEENEFSPCSFADWELNRQCYDVALKSVSKDRGMRYASVDAFRAAWDAAQRIHE